MKIMMLEWTFRISYCLNLTGPSFTIDTACSSSMFAIDQAFTALRNGQCDNALVCGTNLLLHPYTTINFFRLGMIGNYIGLVNASFPFFYKVCDLPFVVFMKQLKTVAVDHLMKVQPVTHVRKQFVQYFCKKHAMPNAFMQHWSIRIRIAMGECDF